MLNDQSQTVEPALRRVDWEYMQEGDAIFATG
jgi:hypothetical protein